MGCQFKWKRNFIMSVSNLPNIQIRVRSEYIASQSSPEDERYFFSYSIEIINLSNQAVKLLSRRWIVTDAQGGEQIIEGAGVVGEQPVIKSSGSFSYTSCALLKTPVGSMEGSYRFLIVETKDSFVAPIPPFRLADPVLLH
jgi:ApaG protein